MKGKDNMVISSSCVMGQGMFLHFEKSLKRTLHRSPLTFGRAKLLNPLKRPFNMMAFTGTPTG